MNQDIRNALLDLFGACLDVTAAGKYHAHMDYMAHVGGVCVRALSAGTDYSDHSYEHTIYETEYFRWDWRDEKENLTNIKALAARVRALDSENQEAAMNLIPSTTDDTLAQIDAARVTLLLHRGEDLAARLGLPRSTRLIDTPIRSAMTIKGGRRYLRVAA